MNKLLAILLLFYGTVFCQERKILPGRIMAGTTGVPNVFVINKNTGAEVKTNGGGNFTLPAKAGDMLAVYSATIEVRDFAISEASFKEAPYLMEVNAKSLELEEVVINSPTVTSQSLGLVPKGYKFETAAESRAGRYAAAAAPSFGIGYAINAISGQLYSLKLKASYAKKEMYMEKIDNIYTEEELVTECNIPKEYARGFVYYAVENAKLTAALKAKDTGGAKLLLSDLALKYRELIQDE
jgi:hypothetical protein